MTSLNTIHAVFRIFIKIPFVIIKKPITIDVQNERIHNDRGLHKCTYAIRWPTYKYTQRTNGLRSQHYLPTSTKTVTPAELRGILKQPTWFLIETSSFSYPGPTLCSCSWYGTISLAPVLPGPPHDQLDLSHVCGRELNRMMATVL